MSHCRSIGQNIAFYKKIRKYRSFCKLKLLKVNYCTMTSEPKWKIEKEKILNLSLEEKRKIYKTKNFYNPYQIENWQKYSAQEYIEKTRKHTLDDLSEFKKIQIDLANNMQLSGRVTLYKGDITELEVDAIVNAANSRLKAGGGVDGAIHRAAGSLLQDECDTLGGCTTGSAKITGGYNLPAKYVIHTVGPQDGSEKALQSCYESCLSFNEEYNLKSIAFPCISTGIYGFPNRLAAHIALRTVRKFLESNERVESVIFCTFMPIDITIYETLMQMYFPVHDWNYVDGASSTE